MVHSLHFFPLNSFIIVIYDLKPILIFHMKSLRDNSNVTSSLIFNKTKMAQNMPVADIIAEFRDNMHVTFIHYPTKC